MGMPRSLSLKPKPPRKTHAQRQEDYRRRNGSRTVTVNLDAVTAASVLYLSKQWPGMRSHAEVARVAIRCLAALTRGGLQKIPTEVID